MDFEVFARPKAQTRRAETEDPKVRDEAREQGLAFGLEEIEAFGKQLTGKTIGEDHATSPTRQDQAMQPSASLRMILRQLVDSLGKVKSAMSKCIQDNTRLVKTVR
jgi:hypothetical protein